VTPPLDDTGDLILHLPRPGEPESALIPGMSAPAEPEPRPLLRRYQAYLRQQEAELAAQTFALAMPDTSLNVNVALQEPAHWSYDFDPTALTSRASYPGIILVNGQPVVTGGPYLPLSGGGLTGPVTTQAVTSSGTVSWSGAPTGWSGSNYGKQLLITGGGNPSVGLANSSQSSFVALANTGSGVPPLLTITQMPSYTDNFTPPIVMATVSAAGALSLGTTAAPGGIVGTTLANNSAAGQVGEVITSSVLQAAGVTITTAVPVNVTSIALTAGDWDVQGTACVTAASGTFTSFNVAISTTSAGFPDASIITSLYAPSSAQLGGPAPLVRLSIASTTTVYLVTQATWTTGTTPRASGQIYARRRR
jgi:hypothetical protein